MAYEVIIPAAGEGKRMGAGKNKLFLELNHIPILIHTLRVFEDDESCVGIILVISPHDEQELCSLLSKYKITKIKKMIYGGKERQHSVYNGLKAVRSDGIVLVHDGARPFIDQNSIHEAVKVADDYGAAIVAVPVKDTIKKVQHGEVAETLERTSLWAIQTPQAFRVSILKEAHEWAIRHEFLGTDEASLVEKIPYSVQIVEGNYDNIKLTTKEDLYFGEAILKKNEKNER